MDFYTVKVRKSKDKYEIYPDFYNKEECEDLMIRGNDFYAVFNEKTGMWIRNPLFVQKVIDKDLWAKYDELKTSPIFDESKVEVKTILSSSFLNIHLYLSYIFLKNDC